MKIWRRLLAFAFCILLAMSCIAASIPEPSDVFLVLDNANVLSDETEAAILERAGSLDDQTGAQVCVVTVEFTGSARTSDFAYDLFNEWGIGDAEKDNGLLILLVTGAEDYYMLQGEGLESVMPSSTLQEILDEYMEPDFAAYDYDTAAYKTAMEVLDRLAAYYNVTLDEMEPAPIQTQPIIPETLLPEIIEWEQPETHHVNIFGLFPLIGGIITAVGVGVPAIIVIAAVVMIVKAIRRAPRNPGSTARGYGYTPPKTQRIFWNNYRTNRSAPPPPPPPHRTPPPGGWYSGGYRPGGMNFGGFNARPNNRSSWNPGSHSSGRSGFGSFGGGHSGGFSSRSGGGGHSRGGGAGRH